ncbi:dihydropteroate synthase [Halostella litorea]|uniref:dihydropteroate synthase n=1 Tax=Halostella litorea TaxID=2528831 RepID=UPI00109291E7|nr:dihydropteroate synthase [Halostella litorea]
MEYHEAANFLYDLRRFGPRPGTESTADLLAHLDVDDRPRFVQVAGSNGKGSTARMVESVLREAGLSVGLYTSPHFEDLRERVRVDGRMVPESAVAEFVDAVRPYVVDRAADGEPPTFFETMTALAVWQFARRDVDVAVLEVGIGGKLDATSAVDPVASAVTTVSLEHTSVLGDTVAEIGRDKAHVAPDDAPLVTGTTGEALAAVREQAGDVVTVGEEDADVTATYGGRTNHAEASVALDGPDWGVETRLPTLGAHQATNAGIAAVLARQVAGVDEGTIARGLRSAHWPGRFEVIGASPTVVLDGAHNPAACERLAETLAEFDYDDLRLVVGAMHEKDHRGMAAALPTPDAVTACRPALSRAEDADVLATVFDRAGAGSVRTRDAVADAVDAALADAGPDDLVVVTGSLYAVAEARSRWTNAPVPKTVRDRADARGALESANVPEPAVRRLAADGVHRTLKLRVQRRQAHALREELPSLGGDCAVSGLAAGSDDGRVVDAVLSGTLAQFEALVDALDDRPHGLPTVADRIRDALDLGGRADGGDYPWTDGTAVMGILNVTPDSFHDGGEYDRVEDAVRRAEEMVENRADIVDVGGESTRPGADPVPVEEELERVVPVVEAIADVDAMISVDTRRAAVAEATLDAGADVVNDVTGLADPEMRFVAADHDAPLVVMHSRDAPVDPTADVEYDDVVEDVIAELRERVLLAEKAGLDREQILVDPGLGFAKSAAESFELLDRADELRALGCPVMIGHSHKSMFARAGYEHGERGDATVAATALAADRGADVVRVHDVAENVAAVRVTDATTDGDGR